MNLPFTHDQFFVVFSDYNTTVWPFQFLLVMLALLCLVLMLVRTRGADFIIAAVLTFLWSWVGLAYHLTFFARINPAADLFALAFLLGAALFCWHGCVKGRLQFTTGSRYARHAGWGIILYALVVYPAWSTLSGHAYPYLPTFGLPCPTTLYTTGVLMFLRRPFPRSVLAVPLLWSIIGSSAAFSLGMMPDLGLVVSAIMLGVLIYRGNRPD